MSETEQDPMSQAAGGLELPKYPVLAPDRIARFKLTKATKDKVKTDATRELLTLVFSTEEDLPDDEGKTLLRGFSVYNRISISPTDGRDGKRARTIGQIASELGVVLKWCGLKDKTPRELINDPKICVGYVGDCRIGLSKETAEFPASNTVKMVLPA